MPWIAGAGAIVGGALSAFGGGSDNKSSAFDLPGYMNDPYKQYYQNLNANVNGPGFMAMYQPEMYTGRHTARMPDWLQRDLRRYANSPDKPNSGFSQARDYMSSVAGGDFLGLNPAMQNAVMDPALDRVASRFEAAGRSGLNPANIQSQNSAGMQALMPFHNAALDRQYNAATAMPGFDDEAMRRSMMWGEAKMGEKQKGIDERMWRHDWKNNDWLNRMKEFQGLVTPGVSGVGTTTQSAGYSPGWGDIAQGALGGYMTGNAFANNWMGSQPQSQTGWGGAPSASAGSQYGTPVQGAPQGTMWNDGMMVTL